MDAQADLGFRSPYISEDTFTQWRGPDVGVRKMIVLVAYPLATTLWANSANVKLISRIFFSRKQARTVHTYFLGKIRRKKKKKKKKKSKCCLLFFSLASLGTRSTNCTSNINA